jgi:hypothetical protein
MEDKETYPSFVKAMKFAEFFKNIGMIIGVPVLIVIGMQIRDAQDELLKSEISNLKTQIQGLENQRYDNAYAVIESQKNAYNNEKELLKKSILMVGGGELEFNDFLSNYMCLKLSKKP